MRSQLEIEEEEVTKMRDHEEKEDGKIAHTHSPLVYNLAATILLSCRRH
jgi:hypothetical protein